MKRGIYLAALLSPLLLMTMWMSATTCAAERHAPEQTGPNDLVSKKKTLQEQRRQYRESVARDGADSPRSREARQNLRSARHDYYNRRRDVEIAHHKDR